VWLHVDLTNHTSIPPTPPSIVQVAEPPLEGAQGHVTNGKFVIPVPLDMDFVVNANSYVLDPANQVDGGDVSSQGFAMLLARYPQYEHVYFNPLLTSDHVGELVVDRSFAVTTSKGVFYPRCQTGRSGMALAGQMPTATALLPVNETVSPERPGLLITTEIDISAYTEDCNGNPKGASEFMLYWKLLGATVTPDEAGASVGVAAGSNNPALRYTSTVDDEPSGFRVLLSTDNGVTWCEAGLLEPMTMCERGTTLRVAFWNESTEKRYLAHFAVMFRADL
jgi:hypothetical protein